MSKAKIHLNWTKRARIRLRTRQDWIEQESCSKDVAIAWASRINTMVLPLADFPRLGRVVPEINREDIREIVVEHTTRVIYKVRRDSCDILSVRRVRERITSLRNL